MSTNKQTRALLRASSGSATGGQQASFLRKSLSVTVPISLLLGAAAPASAQDMSGYDWKGLYVGGDLGYETGTSNKTVETTGKSSGDFTVDGVIGGGAVGYNAQWDALVVGLEGDLSASGAGGSHACGVTTFTCETDNHWLATVRPRVGYSYGSLLPYVTGGVALGGVHVHSLLDTTGAVQTDETKTEWGWTVGGGLETAMSSHWSLKAEYLYVDYADADTINSGGAPAKTSLNENIFRVGVNYRF